MNSGKERSSSTNSPKRDTERNEVEKYSISLTSGDSDNTSEHNVGVTVTSSPGRQPRLEVSVEVSTRSRVFKRPGSQRHGVGHGAFNTSVSNGASASSATNSGPSKGASAALKHVPVVSSRNNVVLAAGWSASSSASNSGPSNGASAAAASNKVQAAGWSASCATNSGPSNGASAAPRRAPVVRSPCSGHRMAQMTSSGACNIPGHTSNTGARPKTSRRQTTNTSPANSSPNALGNRQPGQCDQRPKLIPQYPPHDLSHVKAKVNTGIGAQNFGQARNRGNDTVSSNTRNVSSQPPVARESSAPVSRILRARETATRRTVAELPWMERTRTVAVQDGQQFQNRVEVTTSSTEGASTASGSSTRANETRAAVRGRSESYFISFNDQPQEGGAVGGVGPSDESRNRPRPVLEPFQTVETPTSPPGNGLRLSTISSTVVGRDEDGWQPFEHLVDLSYVEADDFWPSCGESASYRGRIMQAPVRLSSRYVSAVSPDRASILRESLRARRDQFGRQIGVLTNVDAISPPRSSGRRNVPPFYSGTNEREMRDTGDLSGLKLLKSTVNSLENTVLYEYQGCRDDECSICLDSFRWFQSVRRLPCMHLFHAKCIEAWLRIRGVCPNCLFEF